MIMLSIGWSQFALDRHQEGAGNSYSELSDESVLELTKRYWDGRFPGQGETDLTRKVVVPIDSISCKYFYTSTISTREALLFSIINGLKINAQVVVRQPGEDPYVEKYIEWDELVKLGVHPEPAKFVSIVCYSAEALLENNGTRTTDKDWEIVAVLASQFSNEPMAPLTMARNFLQKTGGTASVYSAQEIAESIYHHATNGGIIIKRSKGK